MNELNKYSVMMPALWGFGACMRSLVCWNATAGFYLLRSPLSASAGRCGAENICSTTAALCLCFSLELTVIIIGHNYRSVLWSPRPEPLLCWQLWGLVRFGAFQQCQGSSSTLQQGQIAMSVFLGLFRLDLMPPYLFVLLVLIIQRFILLYYS